ncbi:MAG: response regulator [Sandaracinaceae bacterium]|nr:response regulator [Sandaracinaceae bacterium]
MARVLVVDDSATVRRVVRRTLTQAGFDVSAAADGREGLELAQREPPDIVLVDFVMPQMNGLKFVQAMRRIANLEHVPVVLMSAKADKIGDGFLAQTGALDAIGKPFSPEALLTVTEHALSRANDSTVVSLESVERESIAPLSGELPVETTATVRAEASARIAARLAQLVASVTPDLDAAQLASALEARFEPPALFDEIEALATLVPGRDGEVSLRGRTEHVPLGEVLQLLTQARQTGVLDVEKRGSRSGRAISVCLEEGKVQLAIGRVHEQEFRLGRYLLREGLVEREDLDRILANRTAQRGLLGMRLVKLGYISADDLHRALVQQTSELVYEALRWPRGDFRFVRFASRPEAHDANLALPVASILMEGLRRVDEWRLIEEQVGSFDAVPRRDEESLRSIDLDRLDADERRVLELVDAERTVRAIIDGSRLSSFDACKILFQMATSRLIRVSRP